MQGGGAHGAFTWGVLDRFLEDGRIEIEAISGTSAGAINAVVLADGLMRGGAEGARERLRLFWEAVSEAAEFSPVQRGPFNIFGDWSLDLSLGYFFFDAFTRMVSPYDFNPLNINPLKAIIAARGGFRAGALLRSISSCSSPLPMSKPAGFECSAAASSPPT